eukprot:190899-Chlamydomonas_euryale.AAC.2
MDAFRGEDGLWQARQRRFGWGLPQNREPAAGRAAARRPRAQIDAPGQLSELWGLVGVEDPTRSRPRATSRRVSWRCHCACTRASMRAHFTMHGVPRLHVVLSTGRPVRKSLCGMSPDCPPSDWQRISGEDSWLSTGGAARGL